MQRPNSNIRSYALFGILFGAIFPIIATVLDVAVSNLDFSFRSFLLVQSRQPLHWIIDTAPFFLGLFAAVAGRKQDKIMETNQGLEEQVEKRTKSLRKKNLWLKGEVQERKSVEQKLLKAKEQTELAAKAKEEFLINMSHEIRTPLNAVIGISSLLMNDNPRPEQKESLEVLQFSAKNLLRIINNILDFSKIEAGTIDIHLEEVSLYSLTGKIIQSHMEKAKENDVKLIREVDEALPAQVITDSVRLSQVLNNLVSNAIKFAPNGHAKLEVTKLQEDNISVTIHFSVKDNGKGISDQQSEGIYHAFNQGGLEKNDLHNGTGLGLSIVKNLLMLLGGEIKHKSSPEEGTEFYFDLNFRKNLSVEPISPSKPYKDTLGLLIGKRILVVEDNEINQKVVIKFLNKWNTIVEVAKDGLEAVDMVRKNDYDLILMDLQMPNMDGFQATEEIRKSNKEVPIVALTAAALLEVQKKAMAYGMNDFMTKPFQPNVLYEKLVQLLAPQNEPKQ